MAPTLEFKGEPGLGRIVLGSLPTLHWSDGYFCAAAVWDAVQGLKDKTWALVPLHRR